MSESLAASPRDTAGGQTRRVNGREEALICTQRAYIAATRAAQGPRSVDFEGFTLQVLPRVFPPYVDSGLLARTMSLAPGDAVLDTCSGTGAIALVAARAGARVVAIDISRDAVRNIEANADLHGMRHRVKAVLAQIYPPGTDRFDVIVANPPYTDHPAEDVVDRMVWDAGNSAIRHLFQDAHKRLVPGGRLYVTWADFAESGLPERLATEHGLRGAVVAQVDAAGARYVVFEASKPA